MNKLASQNIKKLLTAVISQGLILILSVITGFILPERMGPENFGYWQIYLFYLAYLNLFGLGFNDGIALYYGGYDYEKLPFEKLRSSIKIFSLYQIILLLLGAVFVLIFFKAPIYKAIYLALVFNISLTCIQCIVLTTFLSVGKTEIYNLISLLLKVLSVALYLALLFLKYTDPVRMICADTVARLVITVLCFILGRRFIFGKSSSYKEGFSELKEKSRYGFLITLALIASMLMPVLGRSVVEHFEPIGVYGIYSFAMSLLSIILSFTSVLGTVIFPLLKKMDPDEMSNNYVKFSVVCDTFIVVALFAYLPLMFIIKNIMVKYVPALDYLHLLLAMCIPLGRTQLLVTPFYKAKRFEKQLFWANIIGIISMFVVLIGLYMIFRNVIAVAIGTTIVLTMWTFFVEAYLYEERTKSVFLKQFFIQLFVMTGFCLAGLSKSYVLFTAIYSVVIVLYFVLEKNNLKILVKTLLKRKSEV